MTDPARYTARQRVFIGLAIADALGAATEFKPQEEARNHPPLVAGYQPGSPFGFKPGECTDDSQMTLAGLSASIPFVGPGGTLPAPSRYAQAVHAAFAEWANSGPPDIGTQTRAALKGGPNAATITFYREIFMSRSPSAGNGGLMRAAAPYLAGFKGESLTTATVIHTAVTHYAPSCLLSSVALARMLLVTDGNPDHAAREAAEYLAQPELYDHTMSALFRAGLGPGNTAAARAFRETYDRDLTLVIAALTAGQHGTLTDTGGYTVSTLQNAVAHACGNPAYSLPTYGQAILAATRRGGDADTIGCVTGALAAASDEEAFTPPHMARLIADLRIGHAWAAWPDRAAPAADTLTELVESKAVLV